MISRNTHGFADMSCYHRHVNRFLCLALLLTACVPDLSRFAEEDDPRRSDASTDTGSSDGSSEDGAPEDTGSSDGGTNGTCPAATATCEEGCPEPWLFMLAASNSGSSDCNGVVVRGSARGSFANEVCSCGTVDSLVPSSPEKMTFLAPDRLVIAGESEVIASHLDGSFEWRYALTAGERVFELAPLAWGGEAEPSHVAIGIRSEASDQISRIELVNASGALVQTFGTDAFPGGENMGGFAYNPLDPSALLITSTEGAELRTGFLNSAPTAGETLADLEDSGFVLSDVSAYRRSGSGLRGAVIMAMFTVDGVPGAAAADFDYWDDHTLLPLSPGGVDVLSCEGCILNAVAPFPQNSVVSGFGLCQGSIPRGVLLYEGERNCEDLSIHIPPPQGSVHYIDAVIGSPDPYITEIE